MSRIIRTLFATALVVGIGCLQETGKAQAADSTDAPESSVPVTLAQVPEPVKLTERSVEHFIDAAKELSQLDEDVSLDSSKGAHFMQGVTLREEALEILDEHGFEPAEFQQIGYSIGMALAAADMTDEDRAAMQESQAQLESMKSMLPAAQYEAMKQQMAGAMNMFNDLPEGNVELAAKFRQQFEEIGNL